MDGQAPAAACTRGRVPIGWGAFALFFLMGAISAAPASPSGTVAPTRPIVPVNSLPVLTPSPAVLRPPGATLTRSNYLVRLGPHPHLGQLPALPARNVTNTQRPDGKRRFAANGDGIQINLQTGCGANQGQLYAVGCEIQWKFQAGPGANPPGTDELEDCYAPATQPNTVADCSAPYKGAAPNETTTLSTAGVWVFGTLDTTSGNWLYVVYLPVGNEVYLDTFSDQFYQNESGQFTISSSTTVYIEATGLTGGSERYEVYVEYTSVSPYCVWTAPSESPAPASNALCNPANDSGQLNAPNGTLTVQWPLSASYSPGTYSIVVYDVTAGQRLAEREVSLNGGGSVTLTPSAGNQSPNPAPAGTPGSTFAYDSNNEDSDKGLAIAASGLPTNTNFTMAISDPTGQVVQSWQGGSGGSGTVNQNWNFSNAQSPLDYPLSTYTVTLLNQSSGAIYASQSFRIVGYQMQTEFADPLSTAVTVSTTPATTTLQFTNEGSQAYGTGNGDPITALNFNDGTNGIVLTLLNGTSSSTGLCAGATSCQIETVVDSNSVSWSLVNYCSGTGNAESCSITATPVTTGNTLANAATLTISNVQYVANNAGPCNNGCAATTTILPRDGLTWSQTNQNVATDQVYFTNGNSTSYSADGHIYLYGYRDTSNTLHPGEEVHGYTVRAVSAGVTSVTYTSQSPTSTTAKLVYLIYIANNSSAGSNSIQKLQIIVPTQLESEISSATIDASSPTSWTIQNCPGQTPSYTICLQNGGGNSGIAAQSNQTIYLDIPAPPTSFSYTDAAITVTNPSTFAVVPDGTWQTFAGPTPAPYSVDSTSLVAYSLNSNLMNVTTSPGAIGSNTTQNVAFTVTNVTTGNDPNPDYLDAIIISVPTANTFNGFSVSTPGWSEEGSYAAGSNTYYVFGLCATQANASYEPPNNGLPSCGSAIEQASSLGAGASLNFTANLTAGSGNILMTMYAHGANGNGWSAGKNFTQTVSTTTATVGFSAIGIAPTPPPPTSIANGTLPTVGADSSKTLGNSYVYTITNTSGSGAGNNLTSVTITVPGLDTSGNNGADSSGTAWTITSAPVLSGSGYSGCSVTSYSSATSGGANGSIAIGGSSCAITPGGVVNVYFTAKAPYRVNDTYRFPATATSSGSGGAIVAEDWTNDTEVQIVLSAGLTVYVDPAADPNAGDDPSPNCLSCAFGTNLIDVGAVANGGSKLATDVLAIEVLTDAASPVGWQLYVSTSNNPSNTGGTFANEFASDVDSSTSISGAGVNYDETSLTDVPTTSPGLELLDTGSGTTARRNPFGFVMNYEVYIDGGPVTPEQSIVTYTFISN